MPLPVFPLLAISPQNSLELLYDDSNLQRASALFLLQQKDSGYLYDAAGRKWTCAMSADSLKNTWLTRLLAHTVYNPLHKVTIKWIDHGSYNLYDLKEEINHCVDTDDDIITQFEEAEVIKAAIDRAISFDQLILALKKYVFDVNEKELWKEKQKL
jgi:hypothetical protein